LQYKAGSGCRAEFSMLFTTPIANSQQLVGFLTATDGLSFGYSGLNFGIMYRSHGRVQVYTMTLTVGASGNETASVTIGGTLYTIPITAGTTSHNAYEIEAYLTANGLNIIAQAVGAVITINHAEARPVAGAYTYTTTGTSAGTFALVTAGVRPTEVFINQEDFDNPLRFTIDPTRLNVASIKEQYLGV